MPSAPLEMAGSVPLPGRIDAILAQEGVGRSLLTGRPVRRACRLGQAGIDITIRLPSYRALPLSCIASIVLRIDGAPVPLDQACLVLAGAPYRLNALGGLRDVWWFILDEAVLFVPFDALPAGIVQAGTLQVSCTIETIEPYVTAGRLSFFNSAERVLMVEESFV